MKGVIALAAAILVATPAHAAQTHRAKHVSSHRLARATQQRHINRIQRFIEENARADQEGLIRYDDLSLYLLGWQRLVPLPQNEFVAINPTLDPTYRFCTPQAGVMVLALGEDFYKKFHYRGIVTNSAIRTVEKQRTEGEHNVNAIAATGPTASLHIRGNTLDIAYLSLSVSERAFVERWLNRQYNLKTIDYQKEVGSHRMYHVIVYEYPKTTGLNPQT